MLRALFAVAIVFAELLPRSAMADGERYDISIVGWTVDGAFLVYRRAFVGSPPVTEDLRVETVEVLEVAAAETSRYLIKLEGTAPPDKARAYASMMKAERLDEWMKKHPLAKLTSSFKSPDRKAEAMAIGKDGRNWVVGDVLILPDLNNAKPDFNEADKAFWAAMPLNLVLAKGNKTVTVGTWQPEQCGGPLEGTLHAYWSPDSNHVAWLRAWPGCISSRTRLDIFSVKSGSADIRSLATVNESGEELP